ncbi:MAG: hypothetical protein MUP19_05535 [Candidatus Aminicenantes bacterium]|nr:hypothetical protein [Candidatus Aminicenantes bacterium]
MHPQNQTALDAQDYIGAANQAKAIQEKPVPPEAGQADRLEHERWRAGALIFTSVPYSDELTNIV